MGIEPTSQEQPEQTRPTFSPPPPATSGDNGTGLIEARAKGDHREGHRYLGSYRRGGIVESAVNEMLAAAKAQGAEVEKVHLFDRQVEFCTNCRTCTTEPGPDRGCCTIADDVPAILDRVDASDAFVLAAPINFWTVTALMKRFIECAVCYGYWPWGGGPRTSEPSW